MENTKLFSGFGRRDITPPMGHPIVGQYYARSAKGVIDSVRSAATYFKWEGEQAVLISLEICLISKVLSEQIRNAIVEATGIPYGAIFINSNHTHTGPLTGKDFASEAVCPQEYLDFLTDQTVAAVKEAMEDVAPARLFTAETEAKGISFTRRFMLKDGTAKTNPSKKILDQIDYPLGEPDETVRFLKIVRNGADDIYLFNFGTHADTVGGEYISPDWPGMTCNIMESAIPGSKCMFLLGPQGDVNHIDRFAPGFGKVISERVEEDPRERAAHARYMARVIAGNILAVCDKAREIGSDGIRYRTQQIQLPTNRDCDRIDEAVRVNEIYETQGREFIPKGSMPIYEAKRIIRMQHEPEFYTFDIYGLRLGDFTFACLPGEPFTDIGRRLYAGAKAENLMVCCQTNVSIGYIPTSSAYDEGGYEALTSSYNKGADDAMVNGMLDLLKRL